jgi:hypothetical protein
MANGNHRILCTPISKNRNRVGTGFSAVASDAALLPMVVSYFGQNYGTFRIGTFIIPINVKKFQ